MNEVGNDLTVLKQVEIEQSMDDSWAKISTTGTTGRGHRSSTDRKVDVTNSNEQSATIESSGDLLEFTVRNSVNHATLAKLSASLKKTEVNAAVKDDDNNEYQQQCRVMQYQMRMLEQY